MKKKLTTEHIKQGKVKDACSCPIALLLKESMPGINRVEVDVDYLWKTDTYEPHVVADNHLIRFKQPDKIVEFVQKFDKGKPVKPFFVEWDDF